MTKRFMAMISSPRLTGLWMLPVTAGAGPEDRLKCKAGKDCLE